MSPTSLLVEKQELSESCIAEPLPFPILMRILSLKSRIPPTGFSHDTAEKIKRVAGKYITTAFKISQHNKSRSGKN